MLTVHRLIKSHSVPIMRVEKNEWVNNINGTSAHKKPFSTNNEGRPANITISKIIYYLSARVAKPGRLLVSKLYTLIYIYNISVNM